MKNTKIVVMLAIFIAVSCLIFSGCYSDPSYKNSDGNHDDNNIASCEHKTTNRIVKAEATGFEEGEEEIVCSVCQTKLGVVKLPRVVSTGLRYKINSDGVTCTVTGMGTCEDEELCIPESIKGYTVTAIRESAFHELRDGLMIKSLYIPPTDKSIGRWAFSGQEELERVYISDGVCYFGDGVFENCKSLAEVRLPDELDVIPAGMFYRCFALEDISLPDGIVAICDTAFEECTSLSNLVFPDDLKHIGPRAFYKSGLIAVEFDDGLEYIGLSAFGRCEWLIEANIPDSVEYLGGGAFAECIRLEKVSLSKGLSALLGATFRECRAIKSITVPEGVMSIGPRAFTECVALEKLELPSTLMYVGEEFISGCNALEFNQYENGLYLGNERAPYTLLTGVSNRSVASLIIHSDTRAIYKSALKDCSALKNLSLPDGLIGVGEDLFVDCLQLEYNFYDNGKYLGNSGNPYLMLVKFDDSNDTVADIHPSTKIIGERALTGTYRLEQVILPDGLVSINTYAFQAQKNLTSVKLPDGIVFIGDSAFSSCKELKSLKIPGSVKHIGDDAFADCENLSSIEFLDGIELFRDWFYWTPVKTIVLPGSVKRVLSLPVKGRGYEMRLETVIFNGTVAEWEATTVYGLEKSDLIGAKVTVKCVDGKSLFGTGWDEEE